MGCNCQPQVKHSQLSINLTEKLKIMTFVFMAFSILKIFILASNTIFNDILLVIILYGLYTQLSYIMGFFAIFLILINLVFESLIVMQIIQNILFGFAAKSVGFIVLIRLIYVTIYAFLLYISFLCSREYKALFDLELSNFTGIIKTETIFMNSSIENLSKKQIININNF